MNILMLNPVHPETPHISAVRAWRFAQELAALGHRVMLLTASGADGVVHTTVDAMHDWHHPMVLTCAATATPPSEDARCTPRSRRRARTAWRMLRHGGPSSVWVHAAVNTALHLPSALLPDVVWATFGRLEAVFAARRIAHRLRRPWVLDIKDNWELYVPPGLRRLMAWRIRGFAGASANARLTQHMACKWNGVDASLIYSGVQDCFLAPPNSTPPCLFEINLVGGIYFPEYLDEFLRGVDMWYRHLSAEERARVRLRHIGAQGELVRRSVRSLVPNLAPECPGYLPMTEMARLCKQACVNAYISHPGTFHHKLLELLACGRPLLTCPSENAESIELAASAPGQLRVAASADDVARTLASLSSHYFANGTPATPYSQDHASRYAWPAQALLVQKALIAAHKSR